MKRYLISVLTLIFVAVSPVFGEYISYPDLTLIGPLPLEEERTEPEPEDIIIKVNPETVNHLAEALSEKYRAVRSQAAWALGDIAEQSDLTSQDLNKKIILSLNNVLKDPSPEVRATAVRALAKIGLDEVVPPIINSLSDRDVQVRRESARALIKLRPENAVSTLIESLNDSDPLVKKYAILILGAVESKEAIEPLKNISNDSHLKPEVIFALARIAKKEAIPFIISGFSDPCPLTRGEACLSLLELEAFDCEDYLLKALKDNHFYVRRSAVQAIGGLKLKTDEVIQKLVFTLEDEDASVRLQVCRSLAEIKVAAALPSLTKRLADEDVFVRRSAAKAMADIGSSAIDVFLNTFSSKDVFSRREAAWALGYLGDKAAVASLLLSLKDKDALLRRNSAWALGKIKDDTSVNGLLETLADSDLEVRRNSAWALGEIKDNKALSGLVEHLSDEARVVRAESSRALGKIADSSAIEPLLKTLARVENEDASVRRESAWALGQIKDRRALPALIRAITERTIPSQFGPVYDDTRVRCQATLSLANIGSAEAVEPLEKCLTAEREKPPVILRKVLSEVLTTLTGKEYSYKKDYIEKTYFIKSISNYTDS